MNRRGCLLGVLTLLLAAAPVARGASYTVNGTLPGGGDCNSIGSWDPVASTCTVPTLTLGAADQLRITAATFEVGALSSAGTIYDLDTLRVLDTFVNTGDVFLQVDPGLPFPRPPVFDLAPGCIGNNSGSIVIGGQATARNYGSLTNSGSIEGDVLRSEGTLDNVAGGAIDVQRLENLGTFSSSGAMNNTHQIVNHGLFELRSPHDIVGSIDNRGTLRFRAQVVVNSGVANQGRIEISTGSGVHLYFGLTNTASGVLEIDGTLRLIDGPLQNAGFVHVKGLIGYLEFGGLTHVTNDGTVLNEGAVGAQELRNHGRFFNHGSVSTALQTYNSGFFENAGSVSGPLANPGTLLNLCSATLESVSGWTPLVGIVVDFGPDDLSWCSVPGVGAYDVVRGDLGALIGSAGEYVSSTVECLVDDSPLTAVAQPLDPDPGAGFWFLVRPNGGSYDSHYTSQAASRDPGITTSGAACP